MAGFIIGLIAGVYIGVLLMCLHEAGSDGEGGGGDEDDPDG